MKKGLVYSLIILFSFSGCETAKGILNSSGSNLSNAEVVHGLKEALKVGTDTATFHLGLLNGFYKDDMIKILMPPEAENVEKTLRNMGLGSVVDKAVLSMNRAAEDASKYVGNIFLDAITQMTFKDAFAILNGDDMAATNYLKDKTSGNLTTAFTPIVSKSLEFTDATKYWKEIFTAYNRVSRNPVNTDLTAYVTQKALDGLFYHIGLEEQKIRKDPAARITDILRKVFANQHQRPVSIVSESLKP